MKKAFLLGATVCALFACRPGAETQNKKNGPVLLMQEAFSDTGTADGVSACKVEFTLPAEWKELDGYDRLLLDFGTMDTPIEAYLNGDYAWKRGFFPEKEGYNSGMNLNLGWDPCVFYLPTDSPLLAWDGPNTLELKYLEGKSLNFPIKLVPVKASLPAEQSPALIYSQMMRRFRMGWNSWDTRSVFTQLYLPEGYGIKVALVDGKGEVCEDLRVGNQREDAAFVHPYSHTYDGSYSEVDASWHGVSVKLRCASKGDVLVMLLTPKEDNGQAGRLRIDAGPAWNFISDLSNGEWYDYEEGNRFMYTRRDCSVNLDGHLDGEIISSDSGRYMCSASAPVLVTVGKRISIEDAETLLDATKAEVEKAEREKYGEKYEAYHSMQTILAWDTIYDPGDEVTVTPVSRNWNLRFGTVQDFGGFVLFDWDTFFATQMLSTGCKELAYSNALEVLSAVDQLGFVPKNRCDHNSFTEDVSQPPVGSMSVWTIYKRCQDKWFLELAYDRLLAWNRWWPQARQTDGLLCWGSNPVRLRGGERGGQTINARLESGLDNSQMWDGVTYNPETFQLNQQDVGLTSMYVMDCDYLALIAKELGHRDDAREVSARGDFFRANLQQLWCEEDGMFYNRNTANGEFNKVTSPTNFYVFLARAATEEQAQRILKEHLLNEEEYWGEWVIPNASKKDPAYQEQDYWRGRIWGPTNFLVYVGLMNYADEEILHDFAGKGERLLMKDWLDKGYIYENWNAVTGDGGDKSNCDRFYHWGALLSYIALIDAGMLSMNE